MGRKYFTVSFDDGTEQDRCVITLMERYGIRGTFNLSSGLFGRREENVTRTVTEVLPDGCRRERTVHYAHNILPPEEARALYSREFIEIASHGAHHLHEAGLSRGELEEEIAGDAKELSALFGREIRGHVFPYGEYDADCLAVMKEAGLCYGRPTSSTGNSRGFRPQFAQGILFPTCRLTDPDALPLLRQFMNAETKEDLVFFLWGHSYELDYGTENACDAALEELFQTASAAEGITFVTNGELIQALEGTKK